MATRVWVDFAVDALDDVEDRLASPMATYKENATDDAPRLVDALRAVVALHTHATPAPCPEILAIEAALRGES